MDIGIVAALVGVVFGALGYWVANFWMQPILRFRDIRNQVLRDFIYYAQVINADGLNDEMQELYRDRRLSNRNTSAQLSAAILDLPKWYLCYLKFLGRNPSEAARHLIGFSNTNEYQAAAASQALIRKQLGLPPET